MAESRLDISGEIQSLEEQVTVLEKEDVIEAEEAKTLREKLEKMGKDASGVDPVKTWEALDHIQDNLKRVAEKAAEEATAEAEELSEAEYAAASLERKLTPPNPEELADALRDLAKKTESATNGNWKAVKSPKSAAT